MAGISKHAIDEMVSYLDFKIKAGVAEPVDGLLIRLALNFVNSKLFSKIPDEDCEVLSASLINIFDDNKVEVYELEEEVSNIAALLAKYIKTPIVDNTPEESAIIEGILIVIIRSMETLIENIKAKKEE